MKKILLPTDFSDNAWNAIVYAMDFFKNEKCEFHILHTYTPTFYRVDYMIWGPTNSAIPDREVDVALANLEKVETKLKKAYPDSNYRFNTLSSFNTLTNEIIELTSIKNLDLIVMGTQGATGAKEIFLGTHTVNVIRKSKIPVLAVPAGYTFQKINSILFPTDFTTPFNKKDLQYITEIAKMHNAKVTILHIKEEYDLTDDQIENQRSLANYFDNSVHSFEEMKGALMPDAIHEYIDQNNIGLLVMMNQKHSFLERMFTKQNIDSIGFHTEIPFLAIRETAEVQPKK